MVAGVGLIVVGAAVEIGTFGTLTVAVAFEEAAAVGLVADGFTRAMRNRDISFASRTSPATWNSSDGELHKKGSVDPSLPANPDDLLKKPEWKETTHPEGGKNGRRKFENKDTGEKLEHDKGRPGEHGHKAHDHYHRPNPNSTGKHDKYLDGNGFPCGDHSNPSHIYHPDNVWWN